MSIVVELKSALGHNDVSNFVGVGNQQVPKIVNLSEVKSFLNVYSFIIMLVILENDRFCKVNSLMSLIVFRNDQCSKGNLIVNSNLNGQEEMILIHFKYGMNFQLKALQKLDEVYFCIYRLISSTLQFFSEPLYFSAT